MGGKRRRHLVPRRGVDCKDGNQFARRRDAVGCIASGGQAEERHEGGVGRDAGLRHVSADGGRLLCGVERG